MRGEGPISSSPTLFQQVSERGWRMYNALKTELAAFLGITKDALHIHIGLAIFFGLVALLRRSPSSFLPWLGLLAFELVNELMDIFHWHQGAFSFEVGDSLKDVVNTMVWPTVALLTFRFVEWRGRTPVVPLVKENSK
jgi:hypothetical protein